MDPERLLGSLIEGALGGRRGRRRSLRRLTGGSGSLINAQTLLTAAGIAWGLYEASQAGSSGSSVGGAAGPSPAAPPGPRPSPASAPPPLPPSAPGPDGVSPEVRRLVRLTLSAARADGDLSLEERGRILAKARELGAEDLVTAELRSPRPLAEILAGASDPTLKAELYALAYGIVRSDAGITGAERIYLAQLAHQLGLHPEATKQLEAAADQAHGADRGA
jgi:uncharacterized membrane protein YebE (DUF533 family)